MYKAVSKTIDLGDGRTINIETGKLAKQADGSVVVKMGDTMLLATVVSAKEAAENVVSVRKHGQGDLGSMSIEEFKKQIIKEITV